MLWISRQRLLKYALFAFVLSLLHSPLAIIPKFRTGRPRYVAVRRCCMTNGERSVCVPRGTPKPIVFWHDQIGVRGTGVALYDYADAWERHVCGTSWVFVPASGDMAAAEKFKQRFGERFVPYSSEAQAIVLTKTIAPIGVYVLTAGWNNCAMPNLGNYPLLLHGVFDAAGILGLGAVAVIGDTLRYALQLDVPVVPHIVPELVRAPRRSVEEFRDRYGARPDVPIVCRHGGWDTFSVPFAQDAVCTAAQHTTEIVFIFLGTRPWTCAKGSANIHFLPPSSNMTAKGLFLQACDVCLHARADGETFGLAVAECSRAGKPLITWQGLPGVPDEHLRIWGSMALTFSNATELIGLLARVPLHLSYHRSRADEIATLYNRFSPQRVMYDFVLHFGLSEYIFAESSAGVVG